MLCTPLEKSELPSLWLAIVTDLLTAGAITTATDVPAVKTAFGLHVFGQINFDLIAAGEDIPIDVFQLEHPNPIPCLVLAGLPCSGKSTVAEGLRKKLKIARSTTATTREPRPIDVDYAHGQYVQVSQDTTTSLRRKADFALPVVFQGQRYYSSVAEKLIARFDTQFDLTLWVDSHALRIQWVKRLMPDIVVVWLDAPKQTLIARCEHRGAAFPLLSPQYIKGCDATRDAADLVLDTMVASPAELASKIIRFITNNKD